MTSFYDFSATLIDGQPMQLSQWKGSVVLVVNVASKCVFTGQYTALQSLHDQYRDQRFTVLGFPCNQFGSQEPKSNAEIQSFCSLTYNVSFPMFAKIDVNGDKTLPLYAFLKSQAKGWFGSEAIKWNFTKFLVGRQGNVLNRFSPSASPSSLKKAIERALSEPS
jgi:glutathione peroxidase